ncbi:MAG: biotin--[Clostridia bacterium]|nr:biotin--[acetyl-CoA-carboxylase] ligase [Clostridia bacterium]
MYGLKRKNTPKRVHFERISSTQDYAREKRGEGRDLIVSATVQTGGKGTKGRSFESQEGGVYISKLAFYQEFPAKNAFQIMAGAATAVCETLKGLGLSPVIKWPNDIFVNGKKICGILIENVFSGANISSSIVGIGLNIHNELSPELQEIATTVEKETGKHFSVEEVKDSLLEALEKPVCMEKYLSYIGYIGSEAILCFGDERIPATLLSVDEQGGLFVEIEGERKRLTSTEVSVRV